jgi:hypothetical protein
MAYQIGVTGRELKSLKETVFRVFKGAIAIVLHL